MYDSVIATKMKAEAREKPRSLREWFFDVRQDQKRLCKEEVGGFSAPEVLENLLPPIALLLKQRRDYEG